MLDCDEWHEDPLVSVEPSVKASVALVKRSPTCKAMRVLDGRADWPPHCHLAVNF